MGGTVANGIANPFKWDYQDPKTWLGIGIGAVVGGVLGQGVGSGALKFSAQLGINLKGATIPIIKAKVTEGILSVSASVVGNIFTSVISGTQDNPNKPNEVHSNPLSNTENDVENKKEECKSGSSYSRTGWSVDPPPLSGTLARTAALVLSDGPSPVMEILTIL